MIDHDLNGWARSIFIVKNVFMFCVHKCFEPRIIIFPPTPKFTSSSRHDHLAHSILN